MLDTLLFDLPGKPALRFLTCQCRIAFALLGRLLLGQGALTRLVTLLLPHQFILDDSALPGQHLAAALGLGPPGGLGCVEHGLFVGPASRLAFALTLGGQTLAFLLALARIGLGRHLGQRVQRGVGRLCAGHGIGFRLGFGSRGRQLEIVVRRHILSDYPCR